MLFLAVPVTLAATCNTVEAKDIVGATAADAAVLVVFGRSSIPSGGLGHRLIVRVVVGSVIGIPLIVAVTFTLVGSYVRIERPILENPVDD